MRSLPPLDGRTTACAAPTRERSRGGSASRLPLARRSAGEPFRALRIDRAAVFGWSMGRMIARLLILREPSLISHAALVGTFPPGAQPITFGQLFLETAQKATYTEDDCKIAPDIDPLPL